MATGAEGAESYALGVTSAHAARFSEAPPPGRLKRVGILALMVAPIVAAVSVDFPLCPTAGLFGIPCPGCGLTRATVAALSGHFSQALAFHPLVFWVAPIYVGVMASLVLSYVRGGGGKPLSSRWNAVLTGLALITFVALFVVWIARFYGAFGGPVEVVTLSSWRG